MLLFHLYALSINCDESLYRTILLYLFPFTGMSFIFERHIFHVFCYFFLLWTHTYWNFIYEIWRPSLKWISSERFGFASKKCPLELPTWNHFKKKNVTFDLREGNIDRNIDSRNSCFTASLLRPLVSVQVFQKSNAQMGLDV